MTDVDLARQLVDYVDTTTSPVTHTPPRPTEMIMLAPDRNEPSRPTWMMAAAATAAVLAIGALLFAATRGDDTEPADIPPPPTTEADVAPPEATVAVGPREQAALDAADAFFADFGRGDAAAVIAVSDRVVTNEPADTALVEWWSRSARADENSADWPSGPCRVVAGATSSVVRVECPLSVSDPVAIALGAAELVWSADVADDGTVRRGSEPLTPSLGTYQPVWSAYAEYLSMFRPDEYAAVCDPATAPSGYRVWNVSGLALTAPCAELTSAAAGEVAAWIAADRPDAPAATGDTSGDTSGDNDIASAEPTDNAAQPLSADALVGYWANTDGLTALFVDFRRDGSFTIGNTGLLEDGAFTSGTYAVEGDTIAFTSIGGNSDGETFAWTASRFGGGSLDVEVTLNGGGPEARWDWVRVSPESAAGLELEAGTRNATPAIPGTVRNVAGIWLRVRTGDVVAIDHDGSYLFTSDGDTLSPTDTGRVVVASPGTIVFTSDGNGECASGDAWTWTDVTTAADLVREGNPRGTTMRTAGSAMCASTGEETVWRLLSPDLVSP